MHGSVSCVQNPGICWKSFKAVSSLREFMALVGWGENCHQAIKTFLFSHPHLPLAWVTWAQVLICSKCIQIKVVLGLVTNNAKLYNGSSMIKLEIVVMTTKQCFRKPGFLHLWLSSTFSIGPPRTLCSSDSSQRKQGRYIGGFIV